MQSGHGIRLLRQDSWETLCSFIISQNNNIARIKKIIFSLASKCGKQITCNEQTYYAFPAPEALIQAGEAVLREAGAGFRAKYILSAAQMVYSDKLNFDNLRCADFISAREMLLRIHGVGPKVAACVLLFGFGKGEAFPEDVWIKRVMSELYPNGLPECALEHKGIAQQYLYHYARTHRTELFIK